MASTPTTKSQVQAYRFVLRRMESALVRKDAVMLHDPMGSHKRATVTGAILACIGMIGFLVWGLFGGKGSVPDPGSVVIGKDSGSVYVVTADDEAEKRLTPMFNIASAKLLVMAQGGGGGGQPIEPTHVKEAALADIPRGPRTGIVNAPSYLPAPDNIASPSWAICDVGEVQDSLGEARIEQSAKITTTVIGGDDKHGNELALDQSLYVKDQSSGDEYLVYRLQDHPNEPNTRTVKAKIDKTEPAIAEMFGLNGKTPRTISTNMLNAIPGVPDLTVPSFPAGSVDYMQNPYESGDVVKRTIAGADNQYFALLPSGKQEISAGAAAVLHASKNKSTEIPDSTGMITEAPEADESQQLNVDTFPTRVSQPLSFQDAGTSCLSWKDVNGDHNITVTTSKGSPVAKKEVELAQSDGNGPNVDHFYMPAGKAAVLRSASNESGGESGPIFLVSDRGVKYGVKDVATAQGLGVANGSGDLGQGPSSIMGTLPEGDFLDPAQASFVYDSIEVAPGENRPPENGQQGQQAAGGQTAGSS